MRTGISEEIQAGGILTGISEAYSVRGTSPALVDVSRIFTEGFFIDGWTFETIAKAGFFEELSPSEAETEIFPPLEHGPWYLGFYADSGPVACIPFFLCSEGSFQSITARLWWSKGNANAGTLHDVTLTSSAVGNTLPLGSEAASWVEGGLEGSELSPLTSGISVGDMAANSYLSITLGVRPPRGILTRGWAHVRISFSAASEPSPIGGSVLGGPFWVGGARPKVDRDKRKFELLLRIFALSETELASLPGSISDHMHWRD